MNTKLTLSIIALILFAAGLTGASVYFWQISEREKERNMQQTTSSKPAQAENPVKITDTKPTPVLTPTPKKDLNADAVVVFTPNGLFTPSETAEINKKYVNPFLDWNNDNETQTVSITVEKYAEPVAGYKYNVSYINKGGGNGGFLYGMNTPLEWWTPECLGGCDFSAEFKASYPEIVKLLD